GYGRCKGGTVRCLRPRPVRYALAASGRHRAGRAAGHQGCEHELTRTHGRGRAAVDGGSQIARRGDLVQRAGESDARIVGDGSLQVRGGGDGRGNRHPAGRRLAVLAVVEDDVTRIVLEGQRSGRPRPGAVHVVRHLHLPGAPYSETQPTSRSPSATGPVSVTVAVETLDPVENA